MGNFSLSASVTALAWCLLASISKASVAEPRGEFASSGTLFPRSPRASYPANVQGAHDFELSYKINSPITDDPFYSVPRNSGNAPVGTPLKVEQYSNISQYTIPPTLSLSRFIYQSKTANGSLVPVSALVLWPYAAKPHAGGKIPVVAWAHGTSGAAPECAPSNIRYLWYQFQGLFELALHGYAVVATDYAGLGVSQSSSGLPIIHEYGTGPAQANDILYSVLAAQKAFPSLSADFVTIGHSEGGGASWAFAQKIAKEPVPGYQGTVALSPFTRVLDLPPDEPILPAIMMYNMPNFQKNFAPFAPSDILTPQGLQSYQTLSDLHGCNSILYQVLGPNLLKPGWMNNSAVQQWQASTVNGGKAIAGPLLVIQGGADTVIHPPTTEAAVNATVKANPNALIEYHMLPHLDHGPTVYAGLPKFMDWIDARFAAVGGSQPAAGYHSTTATLARGPQGLQKASNWYIQIQTEPWEMT